MGKLGYIMQVSVIIPTCLRSEHELIRSIDSALWNGFSDIEIIIVKTKIGIFLKIINIFLLFFLLYLINQLLEK